MVGLLTDSMHMTQGLVTSLGLPIQDLNRNGWDIDNFNALMQGLVIWSWLSC